MVTNTSLLKLNLRDNCMEGTGGAAMAEMLKENCYITGGHSSNLQSGAQGTQEGGGATHTHPRTDLTHCHPCRASTPRDLFNIQSVSS